MDFSAFRVFFLGNVKAEQIRSHFLIYYLICCEYEHIFISLDSIVIPNVLLKTYLADKTIFNSYFYVELKNTDSDIKNKIFGNSIINSALFKVSTDNIPDLDKLNFCRLFGDGMEQKFQINEKKRYII